MFYIGLYRENVKKIFLSETTGPKALIFGMNLPGGHMFNIGLYRDQHEKNLLV